MSNLAVNILKTEVNNETEDNQYNTVEDCLVKRADGKFEMSGALKEIMDRRLAASARGEVSPRSFWQIVNETLAKKS